MGRQLVIITEKKPNSSVEFYYSHISKNMKRSFVESENEENVRLGMAILNLHPSGMSPPHIVHTGEDHHHENGDPCKEVCICGPVTSEIAGDTFITKIKSHSDYPISFSKPSLPEYVDHLEYNKVNGITMTTRIVDTDINYNIISGKLI